MSKKPDVAAQALARLDAALASGDLPEAAIAPVQKLRTRLTSPVRVSVLGLATVGKSSVLNFLAGQEVVPAGIALPTVQLKWGDHQRCVSILPDGTKQTMDHFHADVVATDDPLFVEVEMPLPALRKISIMEVVMGTEVAEQKRALAWAAGRSDIAVWCTQEFDVLEQYLWSTMPDRLKDHGVLAVTKADELATNGVLAERLAQFESETDAEFLDIMPLSTTQAIAARHPDGTVDKAAFDASGGRKLIRAILRQVQQGQQAAIDGFDLLMVQHGLDPREYKGEIVEQAPPAPPPKAPTKAKQETEKPAPTPPPVVNDPAPEQAAPPSVRKVSRPVVKRDGSRVSRQAPAPDTGTPEGPAIEIVADANVSKLEAAPTKPAKSDAKTRDGAPKPKVKVRRSADIIDIKDEKTLAKRAGGRKQRPVKATDPILDTVGPSSVDEFLFVDKDKPAPPQTAAEAEVASPISADARAFFENAITYLRAQAQAVLKETSKMNGEASPIVMERCLEAADWLTDQLMQIDNDDPHISDALETALDAADLMQLMQLENETGAVEEAVTLLTQVKREFEARIAA
ncbi:hypothetical protein [Actibacterium sp. 188UL27-1]|uniref:hypothetical protein n=1 Tax=Actibacterium sp. 188UL27-1 TaxID=2786961 RepID=UPI0019573F2B|nr:hypothetical protein [Actibacterium sp. 188UL27-1]MBM7067978.1 hypothetical protein [Actibacterium sp. 188UL27-1]